MSSSDMVVHQAADRNAQLYNLEGGFRVFRPATFSLKLRQLSFIIDEKNNPVWDLIPKFLELTMLGHAAGGSEFSSKKGNTLFASNQTG